MIYGPMYVRGASQAGDTCLWYPASVAAQHPTQPGVGVRFATPGPHTPAWASIRDSQVMVAADRDQAS
jgi:hypothetical protein